ncbi:MAG TPA: hypothetical protein VLM91_15890 [Candidatus Methylomirabilis sp.]|nr:hypothetical protein [Candidatus Methylomirabilis sp.]
MQAAGRTPWTPSIFLSRTLVGPEIFEAPPRFQDKLFLAYPTLPSDQTRTSIEEYARLAARPKLPPGHLAALLSAYAAAQVLG